jgi:peptidoglycan/xylan/chitin deacetylase (PgdA/CDA1 family)
VSIAKTLIDGIVSSVAPAVVRLKPRKIILAYHRLSSHQSRDPFPNPVTTTPVDQFERQLRWLKGFCRFQTLDDLLHSNSHGNRWDVAVTFDDGYRDTIELGMPLFEKYKVPVSCFVITRYAEEPEQIPWWDLLVYLQSLKKGRLQLRMETQTRTVDLSNLEDTAWLVRELKRRYQNGPREAANAFAGQILNEIQNIAPLPLNSMARPDELREAATSPWFYIGPHTHSHTNLALLSPEEQACEVEQSRERLRQWGVDPIDWFAYPFGKSQARTDVTPAILREAGLAGALTTEYGYVTPDVDPFLMPRISVDGRWNLGTFKSRVVAGPLLQQIRSQLF